MEVEIPTAPTATVTNSAFIVLMFFILVILCVSRLSTLARGESNIFLTFFERADGAGSGGERERGRKPSWWGERTREPGGHAPHAIGISQDGLAKAGFPPSPP